MENEIEVTTVHAGVFLENVTGPLDIKTVHGEIEASFGGNCKGPISLLTTHGIADVSMPVDTKTNLKMGTVYGEIFVDPGFKIEIERTGDMVKYSDHLAGKINGGGLDLTISSTHNNVYLRKSK